MSLERVWVGFIEFMVFGACTVCTSYIASGEYPEFAGIVTLGLVFEAVKAQPFGETPTQMSRFRGLHPSGLRALRHSPSERM